MRSIAHAIERLALLPLVGGALLLLFTGVANINIYRPWDFSFRVGHLAAAWVTRGRSSFTSVPSGRRRETRLGRGSRPAPPSRSPQG